jgi:hypothetical protein
MTQISCRETPCRRVHSGGKLFRFRRRGEIARTVVESSVWLGRELISCSCITPLIECTRSVLQWHASESALEKMRAFCLDGGILWLASLSTSTACTLCKPKDQWTAMFIYSVHQEFKSSQHSKWRMTSFFSIISLLQFKIRGTTTSAIICWNYFIWCRQ